MSTGQEIIARRDRMKSARSNHESRWDRIAKLFDPTSYGAVTKQADGASITQSCYDSTGEQALDVLAKFISSEIINPARKYINIKPSDPKLEDDDELKEWCEESRDRVLDILAKSNFYTEAPLAIKQDAGFGSGSLFWGERAELPQEKIYGFRGLRFQCDKIGRFYIAANANGEIDTNFREFTIRAEAAGKMFPKAPETAKFKLALSNNKLDEDCNFVHAVYPRGNGDKTKGYGNKGFAWASCYVEESSKEIVEESGFKHFPFACPRWDIVPGETYGRGAAEIAYNHMATKNKMRQMTFEAAAIKIRPPVFAGHDSIIGSLRIRPAGLTTVNTHGMPINQTLMPWDAGGDMKFAQLEDEKLRNEIRGMLYVDVIQQVLEMDLKDVNNYTLMRKLELLYQILGSVYGRFEKEFLRALFDPLFIYLYERGLFSPPPDSLVESGGAIDIEFENPLAKAQMADEINSLNLAFRDVAPIVEYQRATTGHADILDGWDFDQYMMQVNKFRSVPAKVTRSTAQIKAIRDARQQAQAEEGQKQDMLGATEGAKNVAPLLTAIQGGKQAA